VAAKENAKETHLVECKISVWSVQTSTPRQIKCLKVDREVATARRNKNWNLGINQDAFSTFFKVNDFPLLLRVFAVKNSRSLMLEDRKDIS
jgi:hypothetical protein